MNEKEMNNPIIRFSVNRVFFNAYDAPGGGRQRAEIRRAWQSALIRAVKSAGYRCEIDYDIRHDAAIAWSAELNDLTSSSIPGNFGSKPIRDRVCFVYAGSADVEVGGHTDFPIQCNHPNPAECNCVAAWDLWRSVLPMLVHDAECTVDAAMDDADIAAVRLSEAFVAQSGSGTGSGAREDEAY